MRYGLLVRRNTILSCLSLTLLAPSAWAQSVDPTLLASRRALIDRATASRTAGRHGEALELAQRAAQIQMTPSLRLFLMQEQVEVGQLAEAYGSGLACQSEASRDSATNARTIERLCTDTVNSLRTRVARLVVTVTPIVEGMRVFVGNRELHAVLLGNDYVVTPGEVTVRVEATGHRTASSTVRAVAGNALNVPLAIEREAAVVTSSNPPDHSQTSGASTNGTAGSTAAEPDRQTTPSQVDPLVGVDNTDVTRPPDPPSAQPQRSNAGPVATMVTGGALLAGGAIFVGLAVAATGEYDALCPVEKANCPVGNAVAGRAAYDRANLFAGIGIGGLALGAAAVGGGLVWMLLNRSTAAPTRTAWVRPSSNGVELVVGGSL